MMSSTLRLLRRVAAPFVGGTRSYSQEGEDLVLQRHFGAKPRGFYVEVGSHDPHRFSNTYLFYRRGWRGICIDPLPGSAKAFRLFRPRDVAVEVGVARSDGSMNYYMFNEPALNTFDAALAHDRARLAEYRVTEVRKVATRPLAAILNETIETPTEIDFLSVDVEGFDLEVLESNDWQLYRPRLVVAECLSLDPLSMSTEPLPRFLADLGYVFHAKTGNSVIYLDTTREHA